MVEVFHLKKVQLEELDFLTKYDTSCDTHKNNSSQSERGLQMHSVITRVCHKMAANKIGVTDGLARIMSLFWGSDNSET